jgi:hypothetical protein
MLLIAATARENPRGDSQTSSFCHVSGSVPGHVAEVRICSQLQTLATTLSCRSVRDLQSTANFSILASYAPLAGGLDPSCPGVSAFLG